MDKIWELHLRAESNQDPWAVILLKRVLGIKVFEYYGHWGLGIL